MAGSLHRLGHRPDWRAAAAVAAAAVRSISAPVMNGGDNVQPERYHVQWFVLAGVALLLLAVERGAGLWSRCPRLAVAHGDLLEQLLPWRWPRVLSALFAGSCWRSPAVLSSA
ncbi:Ferric hydroxamate ABC transporter [Klebsiella pneumoniae]|uniref:Ferric hydroxamate ABC transporter n=1 Tax=Klebsiella pneumoniae TaxID=573 RepID=A0A2X3ERN1_KLEPN|nr:Ferric hydroxamate ABC transporter [Klebsiella pneumoniae]